MYTFFTVISIAAAILQIILFFKVWKMTNDVSRIYDKMPKAADPGKALLRGDFEDAAKVIIANLADGIHANVESIEYPGGSWIIDLIDNRIEEAKQQLSAIGKLDMLPEHLQSSATVKEFYKRVLNQDI